MHITLNLWHMLRLLPGGLRERLLPKQEEKANEPKGAIFCQFFLVSGEESKLKKITKVA